MEVDVITQAVIDCDAAKVFKFIANPDNAPKWYVNIKAVEWETNPPATVGSRIAFVAQFLGRRLAYTYEIVELAQDKKLVMRTAQGPFPMETTYELTSEGNAKTLMRLRNRGGPKGFSSVFAPVMAMAIRRANNADLAMLKSIMEAA